MKCATLTLTVTLAPVLTLTQADVSIECGSEEHSSARSLAWAAIAIYPIGMLVFCSFATLSLQRGVVRTQVNAVMNRSSAATIVQTVVNLFHSEYKDESKGWELLVMGQQLLLVGFLVLVSRGTVIQLVVALAVTLGFLILLVQSRPYKDLSDAFVALTTGKQPPSSPPLPSPPPPCRALKCATLTVTVTLAPVLTLTQASQRWLSSRAVSCSSWARRSRSEP